jgi:hypothetical protein
MSRRRRLLLIAFAVAVVAVAVLGSRLVVRGFYWAGHRDQPIEGWMTVGMVARSYAVPRGALDTALGLGDRRDRRPLAEIAAARGETVEAVIGRLQAAVAAARAASALPGTRQPAGQPAGRPAQPSDRPAAPPAAPPDTPTRTAP